MNAHITRLATLAQHGQPADYGGSEMMRNDLMALVNMIPKATPLNAATEYTRSLERLAAQFARHRLCMSYNDSYFGEPAGELKRIAAELYRLLPLEAFDEKAPAHKAACALTGEAETCPCQTATRTV